jgi:hypothetical protein
MTKVVIHDINQINNSKFQLRSRLTSLSVRQEMRKINRVTQQLPVHFLDGTVWWAQRQYPVPPNQPTQDNTLFGFGVPGATATLGTEIEVNFPVSAQHPVNTQGVFIREEQTNKIFVAHRGRVNRHGQWLSLNVPQFRAELINAGCHLDKVNGIEFIFIGEINSLQRVDVVHFVRNIDQAKSICVP